MFLERTSLDNFYCPQDPGEFGYTTEGRNDVPRRSITEHEGRILADLVKGKEVLEIGTGLGLSAVAMARTAKRVVSVDPDEWVAKNVNHSDYEFRSELPPKSEKFDVVFIDGLHTLPAVVQDIKDALARLKPDGRIAVHDLNIPDVRKGVGRSPIRLVQRHYTACLLGVYRAR